MGQPPSREDHPQSAAGEPLVSVGVPVYNGARFLERTLAALRDQDLHDIEVIISDNGSTDETRAIAEAFVAADPRFTYLRSPVNRGVPWNWNRTLGFARARLFMWNSADDVVGPGHLSACRTALLEHGEATIAFSRVVLVDEVDSVIGALDDLDLDFSSPSASERVAMFLDRRAYQVIGFGGVIRTAVLRQMGGLPAFYGGDIDLAVRMAMLRGWVQVPEQLFMSRRHNDQTNKVQGGDPVDQVRVYRPLHSRPLAFPQWYLNYRLLMGVIFSPVPAAERLRASGAVLRLWTLRNWRFFPFDLKRNVIRVFRGHYDGAYAPTAVKR